MTISALPLHSWSSSPCILLFSLLLVSLYCQAKHMFTHICMCDMRAYTEFYACIKKFRTTNKKKYNVCLPVLDLCQYGHPYLHTFFPANEFVLPYWDKTESCIYTILYTRSSWQMERLIPLTWLLWTLMQQTWM